MTILKCEACPKNRLRHSHWNAVETKITCGLDTSKTFTFQTNLAHFSRWRQTRHKSPSLPLLPGRITARCRHCAGFYYVLVSLGVLSCQLETLNQQRHSWFNCSDHLPLIPQIHSLSVSVALEIIFRLPAGLLLAQTPASSVMAGSAEPDEISTPNLRSEIHLDFSQ